MSDDDSDWTPLMDVGGDPDVTTLAIDPAEHGWSVEASIENSRGYLPDGVESASASVTCHVADPDDLLALAARLEAKAEAMEDE